MKRNNFIWPSGSFAVQSDKILVNIQSYATKRYHFMLYYKCCISDVLENPFFT